MDRGRRPFQGEQEPLCCRNLLDPSLLAEGDLPAVIVFFEEAGDVENLAVKGLVLGAHDGGVSEDPDFHGGNFGGNQGGVGAAEFGDHGYAIGFVERGAAVGSYENKIVGEVGSPGFDVVGEVDIGCFRKQHRSSSVICRT